MSLSWIEAVVAFDETMLACERRFRDQCARVAEMAAEGEIPAEEAMLLVSYSTSLRLIRANRDALLADDPTWT